MKTALTTALRQPAWRNALLVGVIGVIAATTATPAWAQIDKVTPVMPMVHGVLLALSLSFFTITFLWACFKIAIQHAKWSDVAHIFYGGLLAGCASVFAAMLLG